MGRKLNMYMGYSREMGPGEGAVLIFAHTAREARKIAWAGFVFLDTDYLDFAVNRLWNKDWLYEEADQDKLDADTPHVIDSPKGCESCWHWGHEPIGDDDLCNSCRHEILENMVDIEVGER
jgi:hypothetical protein